MYDTYLLTYLNAANFATLSRLALPHRMFRLEVPGEIHHEKLESWGYIFNEDRTIVL